MVGEVVVGSPAHAAGLSQGDEIRSISGIFSGTLAYLFNLFDGTRPFSEIVRVGDIAFPVESEG